MTGTIAVATTTSTDEIAPQKIPTPTGYHLLITMPDLEEKTGGGVILPDGHLDRETTASIVGFVVSIGPDAYTDKDKFPSGPWCEVGDFIVFRSYSGTRLKISGKEFRLINDDTVEAVVDDPRGYMRA